jgi:hypothetical protein
VLPLVHGERNNEKDRSVNDKQYPMFRDELLINYIVRHAVVLTDLMSTR